MMKRSIVLSIYLIVAVFQFLKWFTCTKFFEVFHFSTSSFMFHIEEVIHNDKGLSILLVRMIHNKISVFIPDVIRIYMHFWDILFLLSLLTFIGMVGVVFGLFYLKEQRKKKLQLFLIGSILLIPFVEIFFYEQVPFVVQLLLLWIPLQFFSLLGLSSFLSKRSSKRFILVCSLLVFSIIWMFVLSDQLYIYCIK